MTATISTTVISFFFLGASMVWMRPPTKVSCPGSPDVERHGTKGWWTRSLATKWWAVSVVPAWLFLTMAFPVAGADDRYDVEVVAKKEWEDITNDELMHVYREYFGDVSLSKFRPGFCILRLYFLSDTTVMKKIRESIVKFEVESGLRQYGYSIFSLNPECEGEETGDNLVLGIYDGKAAARAFYRKMEELVPPLAGSSSWNAAKKQPFCGAIVYRYDSPKVIGLGIGRVDLREQVFHEVYDTCIDDALLGALGAIGLQERDFLLMGFPKDIVWKLSTTFIKVLYNPVVSYGEFRFHEREATILEILHKIRPES